MTHHHDHRRVHNPDTSAFADNALTSPNWAGERRVFIPGLLVGAIAVLAMAFVERMY
ncbi:MAG: hypothetical protein K2X11_19490 [Acetobacteraceae bacterium]|nr:hypothetical protein [Acetobacteraceae bacterium]